MTRHRDSSCVRFWRAQDGYAQPVGLRFKDERTVQTWFGGVATLGIKFIMAWYLFETFWDYGSNMSINESSVIKQANDNDFWNVSFDNFMTGFKLKTVFDSKSTVPQALRDDFQARPDRYVQGWYALQAPTNNSDVKNITYIPAQRCRKMFAAEQGEKILAKTASDSAQAIGLEMDGYNCPDLWYQYKPGFGHKVQLQFVLARCTTLQNVLPKHLQPTECAKEEDIAQFVKATNLLTKTGAGRFDLEKYRASGGQHSFIQRYYRSQWDLWSDTTQQTKVKMQRVNTDINTNFVYQGIFSPSDTREHLKSSERITNSGRLDADSLLPKNFGLVHVTWGLDSSYKESSFRAISLASVAGTAGGMLSLFDWVAMLVLGFFIDFAFDRRLVDKLYSSRTKGDYFPDSAQSNKVTKNRIAVDISSREAVDNTWCSMCMYNSCLCRMLGRGSTKQDRIFAAAQKRLDHELDVCEVIRSIRISKLLMQLQTKQRQRELVKFFDRYTVDPGVKSGDDEQLSSDDSQINARLDAKIEDRAGSSCRGDPHELPSSKLKDIKEILLNDFSPEQDPVDAAIYKGITKEHDSFSEDIEECHEIQAKKDKKSQMVSKIPSIIAPRDGKGHQEDYQLGQPLLIGHQHDERAGYQPSPKHQGPQPAEHKFERKETKLTQQFAPGFTEKRSDQSSEKSHHEEHHN